MMRMRTAATRMVIAGLATAILGTAVTASAQPAPPVNDDVVNAIEIAGVSGLINGNSTAAGLQTDEPVLFEGHGTYNSVWYSWTAPASGWVEFDTCLYREDNFDTTMQALTIADPSSGFSGDFSVLAWGDDGYYEHPGNALWCTDTSVFRFATILLFKARRNVTYYIQVAGYGAGEMGSFDMRWTLGSSIGAVLGLCDGGRNPRSSGRGCAPDRGRR